MAVSRTKTLSENIEQFGLQRPTRCREPQQLLPPVKRSGTRLDQSARCQFSENPTERLLGNRQQP